MRRSRVVLPIFLVIAIALPAAASPKFIWPSAELKADLAARLSASEMDEVQIPFEIDDDIRVWSRQVTAGVVNDTDRAETIARAIIHEERLHTQYDATTTITAREVFRTGKANCISLTNLFIGIVRDMGMRAYYVDVTEATTVSLIQGLLVARGHICAGVWFPQRFVLYDFADQPVRTYRNYALLDDREAVATFLLARSLNLTLRPMPADEVEPILACARRETDLALKVKPDFEKAYVNLGTAYLRLGKRDRAVELYQKALAANPRLLGAHLALGYVYAQDGRWNEAREAYENAKDILPRDAYVLYHLGVAQYRGGDLDGARRSLESAIETLPALREAWAGLGLVYRAQGDEAAARRAFQSASDSTPSDEATPSHPSAPAPASPAN